MFSMFSHIWKYDSSLTSLDNFTNNHYYRFGKSNAAYITWIVGGVLVGEVVTGFGIDTLWASVNSGRTYDQVDWQKFVVKEEDDDDEEDEEEEEEGEEEGGDAEEEEGDDDEE